VDPSTRSPLVSELARRDRLLEVGIGTRPGVARALAERGRDVVGVDIDAGERTRAAAQGAPSQDATRNAAGANGGSFRVIEWDVVSAVESGRAAEALERRLGHGVDAVYARRLPAELQRPTVDLAAQLDAACLFTTLGFEEPVVPVGWRSLPGVTLYVVDDGAGRTDRP